MNKEQYFEHLRHFFDTGLSIMEKKNKDYSGDVDPFQNFKISEQISGVPIAQGMLVRIADKVSRVRNLLNTPNAVLDEKIEDTLTDLANYSAILHAYLNSKK